MIKKVNKQLKKSAEKSKQTAENQLKKVNN